MTERMFNRLTRRALEFVGGRTPCPGGDRAPQEALDHEVHRQLQRVPVDSRLVGTRPALPLRADPPARTTHRARDDLRRDVRLRRGGRSLPRSAGREGRAGPARPAAREAVLPGHSPDRRVPGRARRLPQPLRERGRRERKLGKGGARVTKVVPGDDADDVLRRFQHDPEAMVGSIQEQVRQEIKERRLTRAAANEILAEYREALEGYTYLDFSE